MLAEYKIAIFIVILAIAFKAGFSDLEDLEDAQSDFAVECEEAGGVVINSEYLLEHFFYCVDKSAVLFSYVEE